MLVPALAGLAGWMMSNPRRKRRRNPTFYDRPMHDRPLADKGFISYRYQGRYGWIMIGAKDTKDALREAKRSLSSGVAVVENLQVWNGSQYVPVSRKNPKRRGKKTKSRRKVARGIWKTLTTVTKTVKRTKVNPKRRRR